MEKSETVLNFYVEANSNKYDICDDRTFRGISVAEKTVLECIVAMGISSECDIDFDVNKVIKILMSISLDDKTSMLRKHEEYKALQDEYYGIIPTNEGYVARFCTQSVMDFKESVLGSIEVGKLFRNFLTLQEKIRSGHLYWGVKGDRLESILEHTYGTMILAMGIDSEFDYFVDFDKVLRMMLMHETEEIIIGDLTEWDGVSKEEKLERGNEAVSRLLGRLKKSSEYENLLNEFNEQKTIESHYAYMCDKLEYDLQVKMYEEMSRYDYSNIPSNVVTNSDRVRSIIDGGAQGVFDVHYEYDKSKYVSIPCMRLLLENAKERK